MLQASWGLTDMGATKVGEEGAVTSGTIATVRAGMHEIEQRWGQPFRHTLWKYLLPVCITKVFCSNNNNIML